MADLLSAESHFAFGENWKSFVEIIDESRIKQAVEDMRRLFPNGELNGARVLDIGCGSGLSSLAAAMLGASFVQGVDIDPNSVEATTQLLSRTLRPQQWAAHVESVFDLTPENLGQYDIVYSWGVLHHTGAMWPAIAKAADMVKPGGHFALALYRKTALCGLWTKEKKFYTSASPLMQKIMRGVFKMLFVSALLLRGRNPVSYIRNYRTRRGMEWNHDIHDWMGGYPYESASPQEVRAFFESKGFECKREFVTTQKLAIFGAGCDEFVALREA